METYENDLNKEIRLLIVDDSAFMRQLIKDLLSPHKNIIIETASNGKIALQKIKEFSPQVMTLDVEMPVMGGLELLLVLKEENLMLPTIMLSRLTQKDGETTIKALEFGAIDFISKPEGGLMAIELDRLGDELLQKIIFSINIPKSSINNSFKKSETIAVKNSFIIPKIVVIGSSTGGPGALYQIFSRLERVNLPFLIVQHMLSGFTSSLAKRLNDISNFDVKVAEDGDLLKPGHVYVAPGDYHMTINSDMIIKLNQNPSVKGVRPSVDVTLSSVAESFGGRVLSVILTGMGNDGEDGVREIRKLGGKCIAQDKESCVVYGMPEAVIQSNNADSIVPLSNIPEEIVRYLSNWN